MDSSFFEYIQQLEKMAFFSGYPLVYAIVFFIAGEKNLRTRYKKRIVSVLPYAYALVGTLYLGLQLRNLYPDFSVENIRMMLIQPYLTIWALLSILFWIPALGKKPVLSLIHSLVFFFILLKDLISYLFQYSADIYVVRNEMKIYTDSLLLNLTAVIIISFVFFLLSRFRVKK
jgi:hypothetical protein